MTHRHRPSFTHLFAAMSAMGFVSTAEALPAVSTCEDDNSAQSLRKVIGAATNGDTVDLAHLNCSMITLTSGAIPIGVSNLTLQGPTPPHAALTITSDDNFRVFNHAPFPIANMGTLSINNLTIEHGKYEGPGTQAHGGCIISTADVSLTNSVVTDCNVRQTTGGANNDGARGGGIYAAGTVTLTDSTVSFNHVYSQEAGYTARAGGILANAVHAYYSTISGNRVNAGTGAFSYSGGISANSVILRASTVDSNQADDGAGMSLFGPANSFIIDSTIAANHATFGAGGIAFHSPNTLTLLNSTIAFNQSDSGAGGLYATVFSTLNMHSSIVAENHTVSGTTANLVTTSPTVSGARNLIMDTNDALSAGIVATTANPKLAPLGSHGGNTRTCALSTLSPATDQGDNTASLFDDQRGLGFSRTVGFDPDIGAYERQDDDDEIFADGVDF